ncbi:MAG: VTT domain-containing protein [Clostridia bacterium]|nr:VTT domain-containing protein [Clostridia bacterium]
MKEFFKRNKVNIIKALIMLATMVAISCIFLLVLYLFDIVYFDDGVKFNTAMFDSFKGRWYGWILIMLFQVLFTSLLSFIPGASMAFILVIQTFYENPWHAFFISFGGVLLSSFIMYLLGRFGGYNLCKIILGEKDCQKASDLLNNKGTIFFPVMMLFPFFPDDALIMIAGTLKMTLKWFIPSIVGCRGIGVAAIVFGLGNIPYEKFTTPWHWIVFVLVCIVLVVGVFALAMLLNKFLQKRKAKATDCESDTEKQ